MRKQTLTNAERYITPELKEYEEKITGAGDGGRDQRMVAAALPVRRKFVHFLPRTVGNIGGDVADRHVAQRSDRTLPVAMSQPDKNGIARVGDGDVGNVHVLHCAAINAFHRNAGTIGVVNV